MRQYRHKEDGYNVKVKHCPLSDIYNIHGYYRGPGSPLALKRKDLEKLFEPIEGYCCDVFEQMVSDGALVWRPGYKEWQDKEGRTIRYCPSCGQRPREIEEVSLCDS